MNILIFSWRGIRHPNFGGAEISTHEHAKRWVRAGHRVTLFTSFYSGAEKKEYIDGVKFIRRGSQLLGVHLQAIKWYLFEKNEQFDIVIDQFHGIPFFTPLFVRSKKIAFIHETAKEIWKFNFSFILATFGKIFEPLVFKLYKSISFITVSNSTREDLIKWGINSNKIFIIHNGLNHLKRDLPQKERVKTVIFLGALAKDKGIELALEIFSYLKKKYEDTIQFWIVGKSDSRYKVYLKQKEKKLNLNAKFWGYVSDEKKFELLAKSYILINPSIREGWGLVVLEAASVGIPTVAFNVPGLKDSIKDGKTGLLSNYSIIDFTKNVCFLLDHKKEYKRISKNALIWSRKFSWDKSAKLSLKLMEDLLK